MNKQTKKERKIGTNKQTKKKNERYEQTNKKRLKGIPQIHFNDNARHSLRSLFIKKEL